MENDAITKCDRIKKASIAKKEKYSGNTICIHGAGRDNGSDCFEEQESH